MGRAGERSNEEFVALAVKTDGALPIESFYKEEEFPPLELGQAGRQFRNRHGFACLEGFEQLRFRKGTMRQGGPPIRRRQAHPVARAASR